MQLSEKWHHYQYAALSCKDRGRNRGYFSMLHVIINPAGAAGKTVRYWQEKVLGYLRDADYEVHFSSKEYGIGEILRDLTVPGGYLNLVVVGGDGTMNDVLNGIRDFDHTRIALIPCGSGNDLARDLNLPKDPGELCGRILRGETLRTADVGEAVLHDSGARRLFCVSAGAGFDAQVCRMADTAPVKSLLNKCSAGKLVYLIEAVRLIFTWRCCRADVSCAQECCTDHYDRFVFAAGMNHRFEGGGFMLCPNADDHDGKLDLCLVHDLGILDFFRFFPSAVKGRHVRLKQIVGQARGISFRIRTDRPVWVHTDGEPVGLASDIEFKTAKQKLQLMI